jgi:hypothetical protein
VDRRGGQQAECSLADVVDTLRHWLQSEGIEPDTALVDKVLAELRNMAQASSGEPLTATSASTGGGRK